MCSPVMNKTESELSEDREKNLIVAVTGASGAPYAARLLEVLGTLGVGVELIVSRMGRDLLSRETGIPATGELKQHLSARGIDVSRLAAYSEDNLSAPPASGPTAAASRKRRKRGDRSRSASPGRTARGAGAPGRCRGRARPP